MGWVLLLILIGGPLLELSVLIDVGGEIGGMNTVLLCIVTAAVGLSLVRRQGIQVMTRMRNQMEAGEPFGDGLVHGFFLLLAGLLLMFPGFISDAFGALLLIPFVRLLLGRAGLAAIVLGGHGRMSQAHFYTDGQAPEHDHGHDHGHDQDVVDIDGVEITLEREKLETKKTGGVDTEKD